MKPTEESSVILNNLSQGGEYCFHSPDSLVPRHCVPDPPVYSPHLLEAVAVQHLLELAVGGAREVLRRAVPLGPAGLVSLDGRGQAGSLALQEGEPKRSVNKLHDDGGGGRSDSTWDWLLGRDPHSVGLQDGVGEGGDILDKLVGLGNLQHWLDDDVEDLLVEGPWVTVLLTAVAQAIQADGIATALLLPVVGLFF